MVSFCHPHTYRMHSSMMMTLTCQTRGCSNATLGDFAFCAYHGAGKQCCIKGCTRNVLMGVGGKNAAPFSEFHSRNSRFGRVCAHIGCMKQPHTLSERFCGYHGGSVGDLCRAPAGRRPAAAVSTGNREPKKWCLSCLPYNVPERQCQHPDCTKANISASSLYCHRHFRLHNRETNTTGTHT